jgi:hypothetical protein
VPVEPALSALAQLTRAAQRLRARTRAPRSTTYHAVQFDDKAMEREKIKRKECRNAERAKAKMQPVA